MEKKKKSYLSKAVFGLLIVAFTVCCIIAAPITEAKGTLWSLFPPVIAIGLALITKEVYSSLFVGILSGGIIYAAASGTGFEGTFKAVVQDGLITNLSNAYNVGILVFLVVLGIIVVLMNKAGGSPYVTIPPSVQRIECFEIDDSTKMPMAVEFPHCARDEGEGARGLSVFRVARGSYAHHFAAQNQIPYEFI